MPIVRIDMWSGRTAAQKKKLIKDITDAFVSTGTQKEAVQIIIKEVPKDHWGLAGEVASEVYP